MNSIIKDTKTESIISERSIDILAKPDKAHIPIKWPVINAP